MNTLLNVDSTKPKTSRAFLYLSITLFLVGTLVLYQEYLSRYDETNKKLDAITTQIHRNLGFSNIHAPTDVVIMGFFYMMMFIPNYLFTLLTPYLPIVMATAIALILFAQNKKGQSGKRITIISLALSIVCVMSANSAYLELDISRLSLVTMTFGFVFLLFFLVEVERRFTRLGLYPFVFLIVIHQFDYNIYAEAFDYWRWWRLGNLLGYYSATEIASRILLFHAFLVAILAFLIPFLRDSYYKDKTGEKDVHSAGFFSVNTLIRVSYLFVALILFFWGSSPILL